MAEIPKTRERSGTTIGGKPYIAKRSPHVSHIAARVSNETVVSRTQHSATDVYPKMVTRNKKRSGTTPGGRTYHSSKTTFSDGGTNKITRVSQGRTTHQKRTVAQKSGPDYVSKSDVSNKRPSNQPNISKSFTKKKGARK